MDLFRFLNLLATVFGTLGSIYVLKAFIDLSPDLIDRLSQTVWDVSTAQVDSLTKQRADRIVGAIFVLIAFVLALVNLAFVPNGITVFGGNIGLALALAASIAGVAYVTLYFIGDACQKDQRRAVARLIVTRDLEGIFVKKQLTKADIPTLKFDAQTWLGMQLKDADPPGVLLQRMAGEVGKPIPPDFDASYTDTAK